MGVVFHQSEESAVRAGLLRAGRSGVLGCTEMKVRMSLSSTSENSLSGNERVRMEILSFLWALDSYPERFAKDPSITFEEHRSSLISLSEPQPQRRRA
jgi:hypothetical protein